MIKLILVRHGQSEWNKQNRFTGWTDVDLSSEGEQEAIKAGKLLKDKKITVNLAFTSVLKRAVNSSRSYSASFKANSSLTFDAKDIISLPFTCNILSCYSSISTSSYYLP